MLPLLFAVPRFFKRGTKTRITFLWPVKSKTMAKKPKAKPKAPPHASVSPHGSHSVTTIFDVGHLHLANTTYAHVAVKLGTYFDRKQPALRIYAANGEPLFTASVYCERGTLKEGQIFIKSWGEVEGMVEELERLHIVKRTGSMQPFGRESAHICQLLPIGQWGGTEVEPSNG